jgi:hypothetical protein
MSLALVPSSLSEDLWMQELELEQGPIQVEIPLAPNAQLSKPTITIVNSKEVKISSTQLSTCKKKPLAKPKSSPVCKGKHRKITQERSKNSTPTQLLQQVAFQQLSSDLYQAVIDASVNIGDPEDYGDLMTFQQVEEK